MTCHDRFDHDMTFFILHFLFYLLLLPWMVRLSRPVAYIHLFATPKRKQRHPNRLHCDSTFPCLHASINQKNNGVGPVCWVDAIRECAKVKNPGTQKQTRAPGLVGVIVKKPCQLVAIYLSSWQDARDTSVSAAISQWLHSVEVILYRHADHCTISCLGLC